MFPDPRKFMDDVASKLNPSSHSKNDSSTNPNEKEPKTTDPSNNSGRSTATSPPALVADLASKLSSPPAILGNVTSKLPSPPSIISDLTSKFQPPNATGGDATLKDTAGITPVTGTKTNKLAAKGWNIKMPPIKEHMIAGHLVPALRGGHLGLIQKRRRVMFEVLSREGYEESVMNSLISTRLQQVLEQGTTLFSTPAVDEVVLNKDGSELIPDGTLLEAGATIVLRCMKLVKKGFFSKDTHADDDNEEDDDGDPNNEWTEYKRYGLEYIHHETTQGTHVEVRLGAGSETEVRDFVFSTEAEAKQFVQTLEACKNLEQERSKRQNKIHQESLETLSANKSNQNPIVKSSDSEASVTEKSGDDIDSSSKVSSPPAIISDVVSKLPSPPAITVDVVSKLTPPSKDEDASAKDSATVTLTSETHDKMERKESSPSVNTKPSKLAAKGWNMKMLPIKEHMIAGHLVPALRGGHLGLIQKRRRVIFEILSPADGHEESGANTLTLTRLQQVLEQGITLLPPHDEVTLNKDGAESMSDGAIVLEVGATIVLRCMKLVKKGFFSKDTHAEDESEEGEDDDGDPNNEWTEYKRYGLDVINHQKTQGTHVEVQLGAGSETQVRDFVFSTEAEAKQFVQTLEACKNLEQERSKRQTKIHQESPEASSAKETDLSPIVKSEASSPPAIISDVVSKLPSPPAIIVDLASKLKPPSQDEDTSAKDSATVALTLATNDKTERTEPSPSLHTKSSKLAAKGWNMKMLPIKEHMIAGHLVPALRGGRLGLIQKRRRILLEILPPADHQESVVNALMSTRLQQVLELGTTLLPSPADEAVVLSRDGAESMSDVSDGAVVLEVGATIVLRCMKVVKKGFFSKDTDAEDENEEDDDGDPNNEWTEYKRYELDLIHHQQTQGTHVEVRLGAGSETQVRDFVFGSETEASQFVQTLEACKTLEVERTQRQIKIYQESLQESSPATKANVFPFGKASPMKTITTRSEQEIDASNAIGDKIQLLIEIVSAVNLPAGDIFTSDPYVIVRMGNNEIHRTEYIPKTLDPIWTLRTGSLFLVVMTPEEFFGSSSGMSFIVKDFDAVGPNEILGEATVKLQDLLEGKGERVECDIFNNSGPKRKVEDKKKPAKLVLRYKVPSQDDIDFMEYYSANKKEVGALAEDCFLPPKVHTGKLLEQKTRKGPNSVTQYRVKPAPDPARVEETKWMTREQIEAESKKGSTNWIEVGSGNLGKIFVEVLSCDNLTSFDLAPVGPGSKISAYACLLFEDCVVNTDVINDDINPKWMPWSQRAFMFHVRHPSSQLMVGIFDFDGILPGALADSHAPIGRAVVPLTNFCPNTNYTLQYPLYKDSGKKTSNGNVSLRLRIEWENERQALIASFAPRPPIYLSVLKKKEFSSAFYTAEGMIDQVTTFSPDVCSSYIQELASYQCVVDFILNAATTVLLWRGTLRVGTVLIPVHSITAFVWGVLVTQNFNRLPSFWLFSIAWFFLATMEHVRSHPSKWHHCRSYIDLIQILALSKSFAEEIAFNDNLPAIEAYDAEEEEREKKVAAKIESDKKRKKEEDDLLKEEQLAANATEVEITTVKKAGIALNPLGFLFPVQKQVGSVVVGLRIVKSIVLWQENYIAFWIVTLCLAASFVLFWVPFGIILRWTIRIVVWITLGPWMKLVDIYYIQNQKDDATKSLQLRQTQLSNLASLKQFNRERALKLKDMTKYLFGNYLLRVPRFKEDRSPSYPLPASYATPKPRHDEAVTFSGRYYGQHLSGDMVPQRDVKVPKSKPKPRGLIDPAAVPLLSRFDLKNDYGAVDKPLKFLFGKR